MRVDTEFPITSVFNRRLSCLAYRRTLGPPKYQSDNQLCHSGTTGVNAEPARGIARIQLRASDGWQ